MKYYIQRGVNEYGPYTLADLQRYVAQGNIAMNDLTRSEGMTDWVPVSQVLGDIPVPVTAPAMPPGGGTVYGGGTAYGVAATPGTVAGPIPPDFHWALVLLTGVVTCWLFAYAWLIVEAVFIRKIKPDSKGLLLMSLAIGSLFGSNFIRIFGVMLTRAEAGPVFELLGGLLALAGLVLYLVAVFVMRSDLENYYNTTEPIQLRLSGVMTFFFAVFYFQHHFSRIAQWKKTGVLTPQS